MYEMLENDDKCFEYHMLLEDWRHRRANHEDANVSTVIHPIIFKNIVSLFVLFQAPLFDALDEFSLEEMTRMFFELCSLKKDSDTAAGVQNHDAVAEIANEAPAI